MFVTIVSLVYPRTCQKLGPWRVTEVIGGLFGRSLPRNHLGCSITGGSPRNGWFIVENPKTKWFILIYAGKSY
jgi:hypothetical protein